MVEVGVLEPGVSHHQPAGHSHLKHARAQPGHLLDPAADGSHCQHTHKTLSVSSQHHITFKQYHLWIAVKIESTSKWQV